MQTTQRNRALSFVLTIAMLVSLIAVIPTTVNADDVPTPIIIDMSSQKTAEKYLTLVSDNADGLYGQYSFDTEEGALSLKYSTSTGAKANFGSRMKFTLKMKDTNILADGQSYMVITYKTNIDDNTTSMKLDEFWGRSIELAPDVSVSGDEYVHTEPINIKVHSTNDYFNRLAKEGKDDLIYITTSEKDKDKYFYIKEIAFFASAEEARAYYAEPLIIDFATQQSAEENIIFGSNATGLFGEHEFDPVEGALSLKYATSGTQASYGSNVKFGFKIKNLMDPGHMLTAGGEPLCYMVVTYKTNISTDAKLKLDNLQNQTDSAIVLASDVSVSGGNYVRTDPVNIKLSDNRTDYFKRLDANIGDDIIFVSTTEEDKYFYIKEIAFFASAEEADDYYSDPLPIESEEEDKGSFNTGILMVLLAKKKANSDEDKQVKMYGTSTVIDLTGRSAAEVNTTIVEGDANGINGEYEFDESEGALSLKYVDVGEQAAYGGHVKFTLRLKDENVLADDQKYMVVTYKTDMTKSVELKLGNFWGDYLTLASDVTVSGGEYVRTEPVDINIFKGDGNFSRDYFERLNRNLNHDLICVDTTETDKSFYIKEIAFFSNLKDAKTYAGSSIDETIVSESTSKEEATDSNAFVISMNNKAVAEENLIISEDTDTGLFGQYSFDTEEGALSLKYSTSTGEQASYGGRVKFALKMKNTNMLTDEKTYIVVTYKTNITEKVPMKLGNFWNEYLELASDVSVSNGEYVHTDPINIKVFDHETRDYFERLNKSENNDLICVDTTESDKYFYIKEIAFFTSVRAAEDHYGD